MDLGQGEFDRIESIADLIYGEPREEVYDHQVSGLTQFAINLCITQSPQVAIKLLTATIEEIEKEMEAFERSHEAFAAMVDMRRDLENLDPRES